MLDETPLPAYYFEALREADQRFQEERDRRYTEVKAAEEKALKVKETADLKALDLASQIQTYKDQQHNGLLQQIDRERAKYATQTDLANTSARLEALIKPIADIAILQQGRGLGETATSDEVAKRFNTRLVMLGVIVSVVVVLVNILIPLLHLR